MQNADRIKQAIDRFDELNAEDPNKITDNGKEISMELFMAQRMSFWVDKLVVSPSEALLLAARCQHICRWKKPRSSYPEGRVAYLQWRKDLHSFHAEIASGVLKDLGFEDATIQAVDSLLHKKNRNSNPDAQAIEDALCLSFLENQFAAFIQKHEGDKLINIVQKTWKKMSDKGHQLALTIAFTEEELAVIKQALEAN